MKNLQKNISLLILTALIAVSPVSANTQLSKSTNKINFYRIIRNGFVGSKKWISDQTTFVKIGLAVSSLLAVSCLRSYFSDSKKLKLKNNEQKDVQVSEQKTIDKQCQCNLFINECEQIANDIGWDLHDKELRHAAAICADYNRVKSGQVIGYSNARSVGVIGNSGSLLNIINNDGDKKRTKTPLGELILARTLINPVGGTWIDCIESRQSIIKNIINNENVDESVKMALMQFQKDYSTLSRVPCLSKLDSSVKEAFFDEKMISKLSQKTFAENALDLRSFLFTDNLMKKLTNKSPVQLNTARFCAACGAVGLTIFRGFLNNTFLTFVDSAKADEGKSGFINVFIQSQLDRINKNLNPLIWKQEILDSYSKYGFKIALLDTIQRIAIPTFFVFGLKAGFKKYKVGPSGKAEREVEERVTAIAQLCNSFVVLQENLGSLPFYKSNKDLVDYCRDFNKKIKKALCEPEITRTGRLLALYREFSEKTVEYKPCIGYLMEYVAAYDALYAVAGFAKSHEKDDKRPVNCSEIDSDVVALTNAWGGVNVSEPVLNDISYDCKNRNIMLTAPNSSGKSGIIKTLMRNVVLAQTYGLVLGKGKLYPFGKMAAYLNVNEDPESGFSTGDAQSVGIDNLTKNLQLRDDIASLIVVDEPLSGTPGDVASMLLSGSDDKLLNILSSNESLYSLIVTHFKDVAESAENLKSFKSCHMEVQQIDDNSFKRTHKFKDGQHKWWFKSSEDMRKKFILWNYARANGKQV